MIVTIGGITLRVPECPPEYKHLVPPPENYVEQGDEMRALALAFKYNTPAMLVGCHGAGKNAAIREFARRLGRPLLTASLSEGTTTDHLIGAPQPTPVGDGDERGFTITWLDGVLTTAIRIGAILNLDEPNMADNRTMARLNDFLANGYRLSLPENPLNPSEIVSPVDQNGDRNGFYVVFTANPSDNGMYSDRQRMDEAFTDRLTTLNLDYIGIANPEAEVAAVVNASGCEPEVATKLVTLFNMIRRQNRMTDEEMAKSQTPPLYSTASTRAAIRVARFSTEVPMNDAFALGYLNNVSNPEDRAVIQRLFLEFFATEEMLDAATEITNREEEVLI